MKSSQKAFTIIELLVVVAIIAILTAITVANFTASKSKGRDTKRVSDIGQLQNVFELYLDRCNQYPILPSNLDPTTTLTTVGNGCPSGVFLSNFISKLPTPPNSGETYTYAVNNAGAPTDYVLKALLENNNTSVLNDVVKVAYPSMTPSTVDCSVALSYCVLPR